MSRKVRILCIYFVLFYAAWAGCELVLRGLLTSTIAPEDGALFPILFDWVLKNLVWTFPAWMMMGKLSDELYIKRREMLTNRVNPWEVAGVFSALVLLLLVNQLIYFHGIHVAEDFNPPELLSYVFVGITEEFVFRGLLLNTMYQEKHPYLSVGINALLFLTIHFPIWIQGGIFISAFTSFGFVSVLVLSVLFSWSFLYFKNIWVPVGLHMLYDILITIFAG